MLVSYLDLELQQVYFMRIWLEILKVADTFPANKYNNKISELHRNAINDKNIRKWKLSYMKTTRSRRHDSLIGEITGDTNINMKLRPLNDQGQQ